MMVWEGRYLLIRRGVVPCSVGAMIADARISRATRNAVRRSPSVAANTT